MVLSKPSLRAFTFIVVSWILFRFVINFPLIGISPAPVVALGGGLQNHVKMAQLELLSEVRRKSIDIRQLPQSQPAIVSSSPKTLQHNLPAQHLQQALTLSKIDVDSPENRNVESPIAVFATQAVSNAPLSVVTQSNKLRISGWLLLRPESLGQTIATAGQLGGSQTGAKFSTELTSLGHEIELDGFIRTSAALTPVRAGEAAIGVSLRHTGRFVSELQFERRIKLSEGGRSDFALVGSTSLYNVPITPRIKLEGYAQGGIVGIKARDLFIDGSVRVDRSLIESKNNSFSAGVGIWTAAQPNVHRIDVGPHVTVKQRVAKGTIRISGEWRFRLEGNARPRSGPSLSAGFDF